MCWNSSLFQFEKAIFGFFADLKKKKKGGIVARAQGYTVTKKCKNNWQFQFFSKNARFLKKELLQQIAHSQWRKKQKKIHSKKLIVAQSLYNK